MKVESEDILKPGAVLTVKKIDFNDPEVRTFLEETKKDQQECIRRMRYDQDYYDNLRKVITI